jgi:hypothetical protein
LLLVVVTIGLPRAGVEGAAWDDCDNDVADHPGLEPWPGRAFPAAAGDDLANEELDDADGERDAVGEGAAAGVRLKPSARPGGAGDGVAAVAAAGGNRPGDRDGAGCGVRWKEYAGCCCCCGASEGPVAARARDSGSDLREGERERETRRMIR